MHCLIYSIFVAGIPAPLFCTIVVSENVDLASELIVAKDSCSLN